MRNKWQYKSLKTIVLSLLVPIVSYAADTLKPTLSKNFMVEAQKHYAKKDHEKAADLVWENIEKCNRQCLLFLSQIHIEQKDGLQTLRAAQMLLSKFPKDAEAYTIQGVGNTLSRKPKEAIESFKLATELNSKYEAAYEGLYKLYFERKNFYELRILLQDMVEHLGPKPVYLDRLCDINVRDGLGSQAKSDCQMAIDKNPTNPENYVNLAQIAISEDEMEKAKSLLRHASTKFPKSEIAQSAYAVFFENQKNYADAYKYFKLCLDHNPSSERCLVGVGSNGPILKKHQEAFEAYKKACKINRKNAAAIRRTASSIKSAKELEWQTKYETLADQCAD